MFPRHLQGISKVSVMPRSMTLRIGSGHAWLMLPVQAAWHQGSASSTRFCIHRLKWHLEGRFGNWWQNSDQVLMEGKILFCKYYKNKCPMRCNISTPCCFCCNFGKHDCATDKILMSHLTKADASKTLILSFVSEIVALLLHVNHIGNFNSEQNHV